MSIQNFKKSRPSLFFSNSTFARFIQRVNLHHSSTNADPSLSAGCSTSWYRLTSPNDNSADIKHFHLIRCEPVRPTQDCWLVFYSTRKRVVVVFITDVGIYLTASTWIDVDIVPLTKRWTMIRAAKNCAGWLCYHAFKWSKPFFVMKRKYKRIWRWTAATARFWKTRQQPIKVSLTSNKLLNGLIGFQTARNFTHKQNWHGFKSGFWYSLTEKEQDYKSMISLRQRLFCIYSNCPKYVSSGLGMNWKYSQ